MNTPKCHQQKQRQAQSSAKKGPVKGLRNVLAQPQEFTWPIVKDEKAKSTLHRLLTELLPRKECTVKTMSWAQLRKLTKEQRLDLKKESHKNPIQQDAAFNSIVLGVNAITRALEKGIVCSILLDSNVDPLFLVKHIVIMGLNRNIPVLMVPFIKTVTLNTIGFPSIAIALKNTIIQSTSDFCKLHETISNLAMEFSQTTEESMSETNDCVEEMCTDKSSVKEMPKVEEKCLSNFVYQYRSSRSERAFIPPDDSLNKIDHNESSVVKDKSWPEFIPMNDDDDDDMDDDSHIKPIHGRYMDMNKINSSILKKKKDIKSSYLPLKVKRIQGNPVRLKATKIPKSQKNNSKKQKKSTN